MSVTKVVRISAWKGTKSIWRPESRTRWGSLQRFPDLAGFKSGGRDKRRRKRKKTEGDGQLREETKERGKGRKGRREGKGRRRNFAPTVISKSLRLWLCWCL